ncbi:cyclophilin type peptidyl-prolyl cis-trans isomerase/CLD family protein [[Clostridium] sordellii VPI 9048]|nr:cyclophilin type peptidyl-prolyl cis-trans isomerase/CLD family protein [[Clostridium] sordellii VPI 9048] [Paeniclostridium sordellii VPI 9048]
MRNIYNPIVTMKIKNDKNIKFEFFSDKVPKSVNNLINLIKIIMY